MRYACIVHLHVSAGNACYRSSEDVKPLLMLRPRLVRKEIFSRMKWDNITCVEEFSNDTYKGNMGQFTV
jgi:hypothetical protein